MESLARKAGFEGAVTEDVRRAMRHGYGARRGGHVRRVQANKPKRPRDDATSA